MKTYSPSALNNELSALIAARYPAIIVEGEIGNLSQSGHAYFTLRDASGQLGCVAWKAVWRNISFRPKVGDKVICRGKLGVFAGRGVYQLYVTTVSRAGEGDLARKLAEVKARLMKEGLLDPRRKRALPAFPKIIGVATSLTGAALQDFLKVSRERFPSARILVAGCTVQGPTAPLSVIRALQLLVDDGRSEVIVLTRGGGSKEDLLAFQDEALARVIADCPIPVLSAIGHQVDTSLSDLVADAVAPTPSAAAALALPDGRSLCQSVDEARFALLSAMRRRLAHDRERLRHHRARLRHPGERLIALRARLVELRHRARRAVDGQLQEAARSVQIEQRLTPSIARLVAGKRQHFEGEVAHLHALSPLAVLGRGFALVHGPKGIVDDPKQVRPGDRLRLRLRAGQLLARVEGEPSGHQLALFESEQR